MKSEIKLWKVHHTGKIGWWMGQVIPDSKGNVELHTSSAGSAEAKAVTHKEIVMGKNIGRANETTDYEQACKELASKANKKRDGGYVDEKPEPGSLATNTLGFVKPQKAMKLKDVNQKNIDWDNTYAQRKYDGHRASHAGDLMYSSGGKPIELPQFEDLRTHLQLDGELYLHGLTLQEIGKLIKKYRPGETEKLEYHVFDHVDHKAGFGNRVQDLVALSKTLDHPKVVFVETFPVSNMAEVMELHARFLSEGYEGTMLRTGINGYKGGSRCIDIIKIKDMDDAEWPIVGVTSGKPKLYRGEMLEQAVFVLRHHDGQEFTVLAHGTVPEKASLHAAGAASIGKSLTVQHFGFTDGGIPNLPVAKGFRENI